MILSYLSQNEFISFNSIYVSLITFIILGSKSLYIIFIIYYYYFIIVKHNNLSKPFNLNN